MPPGWSHTGDHKTAWVMKRSVEVAGRGEDATRSEREIAQRLGADRQSGAVAAASGGYAAKNKR